MLGQARAESGAGGLQICSATLQRETAQGRSWEHRPGGGYSHCTVLWATFHPGASQVQPMSRCIWMDGSKTRLQYRN